MIVARRPPLATLHELNTVYSLRDLYDLIEIAQVDAHNRRLVEQHQEEELKRASHR